MKNNRLLQPLFLLLVLVTGISTGCSKSGNNPDDGNNGAPAPRIDTYQPAALTTGATVTLTGTGFGSSLSAVTVGIGTLTVSPLSVSPNSIVFVIPANLLGSGSAMFDLRVWVSGVVSNTIRVTVSYVVVQPRGWFYINKEMTNGPGIPYEISFYDDSHQFGLAFGRGHLSATSNDGASWGGIWPADHWGSAFDVYDEDEAWIETNQKDIWVYNYDYFNATAYYARLDTITSIPALAGKAITGAHIYQRNKGYLLTHDGSVIRVNGSFRPADLSLEYQSSVYTSMPLSYDNNDYYDMRGLDADNLIIAARPDIAGITTPMIILKRNGVYQEYRFTTAAVGWPYRTQFADNNNVFFLSLNYDLFKLNTGTNSWVKLTTPKFNEICFISGTTGYASTAWAPGVNNYYIYKTTDGGNTWALEFALDPLHYVYRMYTKNNKVWVLGENIASHKNFMLKFNP